MNHFVITNAVYEIDGPSGRLPHRVLHIDRGDVWLFGLEPKAPLPWAMGVEDFRRSFDEGRIRHVDVDVFAANYAPDDELTEAAKRVRNRHVAVVIPLVACDGDGSMPILDRTLRGGLVEAASQKHGMAKDKVYRALRTYWRRGQSENALLPMYENCGRGEKTATGRKRGRPLSVGRVHDAHVGVNVDGAMKKRIIAGARRFFSAKSGKGRMTKREAYQKTLEHFFRKRIELVEGVETPIVRETPDDDNRLPTFDQWNYHVEQYLKRNDKLIERYDEREMALKRRPVLGNSDHMSRGPGDLFLIDATVADIYLLSSYDLRWTIGRPILYLVVDHYSRMIVGFHVALEGPSWNAAMMALANAFSDKVAFCKKHGVDIVFDDWPCDVAPARLTADRGEVISKHADYLVPGFRMSIHDTPPFRADFKSFVEGQFKITNEKGLKKMPGWVDKLKDRGGHDYRYDATLTMSDFIRMMIELILHNNRKRGISSNVDIDYPQGEGLPKPLDLWNWGLANATPSMRRLDPADVRRNLLPTYDAITSRLGLSVMGGRLHYTLQRAIDEGWFFKAPTRGGRHHKLAIDPFDVSVAYLRIPGGEMEQCTLTQGHEARFAGRTMADVEAYFDRGGRREKVHERETMQHDADLNAKLDSIKDAAAARRRRALDEGGRRRPITKNFGEMRNAERDVERLANATSMDAPPLPSAEVSDGGAIEAQIDFGSPEISDDDRHLHIPD